MKHLSTLLLVSSCLLFSTTGRTAEPTLTVYNQNFAVVRETIPLDLRSGTNSVSFTDIAAHVEPDSVVLRDSTGQVLLQILEQNYRADPISQALLLSVYEGQSIDFEVKQGKETTIIPGKIIRSGYVPHQSGLSRYGRHYAQTQMLHAHGSASQPIIEIDGKLRFQLPGLPLFPVLADDTILKPTIHWLIETDKAGQLDAELSYITGGMSWEAAYNVIAPEKGDLLELTGWVTIDNQSGKTFADAKLKLMAGDVSKITDEQSDYFASRSRLVGGAERARVPPVTEKTFDEYHLYSLNRLTTLHDRETKQVEFVRASGVQSQRLYIYDGAQIDWQRYRNWSLDNIRREREYGTQSNPKVWVMQEFQNAKDNHLGIPLPQGRVRFYRRDTDGQIEFTGENLIDHTPKDETIRMYTGNAFDLTGERKRLHYVIDTGKDWLDESFEITLRNHKEELVEIRVVEHLYRGKNWQVPTHSDAYEKLDSQTLEFRVRLQPDEEKKITYTVHYTW